MARYSRPDGPPVSGKNSPCETCDCTTDSAADNAADNTADNACGKTCCWRRALSGGQYAFAAERARLYPTASRAKVLWLAGNYPGARGNRRRVEPGASARTT